MRLFRRSDISNRLRLVAPVVALLLAAVIGGGVMAQSQIIQSTVLGEVPSTGGFRPGPIGAYQTFPVSRLGVVPVAIEIDAIDVNSEVETIEVVDGVMDDPTGPWIVSWYRESSRLGEGGNTVMAGHLDYWDVGPAIFYNIGQLKKGDQILVTGEDNQIYVYEVSTPPTNFNVADAPIQDIVGPTDEAVLTLITCGGPFDYQTGEYLQRTVVKADFKEVAS